MPTSREDTVRGLLAGYAGLKNAQSALLLPALYDPDSRLGPLLKEVGRALKRKANGTLTKKQTQQLGYTLEKVALLVFQSLVGINSIKSYQSAGPQHDLVVKGLDECWRTVCETINVAAPGGMLVEAKATGGPVGDKEFERLGNIVTHHLGKTIGIGIFLALEGASGFPKHGQKVRTRSLQAARVTQLIVYHAAKKPIVVLDWEDIKTLDHAGALITVLERKVREIEEMSGAPKPLPTEPVDVDLPKHLKPLCRF